MEDICFQKYIYSKCLRSKLLGSRLYVLDFILSRKKVVVTTIIIDKILYFHISRAEIARNIALDEQSVSTALKFLKNHGFIQTFYDYHDKKLFIAPIYNICNEYMISRNDNNNDSIAKENEVLFEFQKKKFSPVSEELIIKLVEKNRDLFGTRIPKEGNKISASFTKACQFLDDIYNGHILDPRLHPTIASLDLKKCSFYNDEWKEQLMRCQDNWNEIHKLLNKAVRNYRLMKDNNRMPMKKASLPRSIDAWFEDPYGNNSYFIYSFIEPPFVRDRNNEQMADAIFDSLPVTAQKGGNRIFDLNPSMSDMQFWENIKNMVDWGNILCKHEPNAHYWIDKGADIPSRFCDYMIDNEITVSVVTLNLEKAVECNGPWVWFLNEVIVRHNLDTNIINYSTAEELQKYYEKREA